MDDLRARFNARVTLHVRDGWEVVWIASGPPDRLEALLTKTAIGRPRAAGLGVAAQAGITQRYCRRVVTMRDGSIRVSNVACPPDLTIQPADRDISV